MILITDVEIIECGTQRVIQIPIMERDEHGIIHSRVETVEGVLWRFPDGREAVIGFTMEAKKKLEEAFVKEGKCSTQT